MIHITNKATLAPPVRSGAILSILAYSQVARQLEYPVSEYIRYDPQTSLLRDKFHKKRSAVHASAPALPLSDTRKSILRLDTFIVQTG